MEKSHISGVAKDKNIARLALVGLADRPGIAFRLFSLLAKAAELIEPNETCLERRTFESPDVNPRPGDAQPVNEPTKAPKKDKQKTSWIRSMARKFSQYMSEDEEEI